MGNTNRSSLQYTPCTTTSQEASNSTTKAVVKSPTKAAVAKKAAPAEVEKKEMGSAWGKTKFDPDEGGTADHLELAVGWLADTGNPAALVGGAALANYFEEYETLKIIPTDEVWRVLLKMSTGLLLVSAFVLEMLVIFITSVTHCHILGYDKKRLIGHTPMGLLHDNFKFEYVATRFFFFQGILNWLTSIALQIMVRAVPSGEAGEAKEADPHMKGEQQILIGIAAGIFGIVIMVLAFHNGHLTFYRNYFDMLRGLITLGIERYFTGCWPPRPLPIVAIIPFAAAFYFVATGLHTLMTNHPSLL